jgi:hypothetical protein
MSDPMRGFPIERQNGVWIVWSMRVEHTTDGEAKVAAKNLPIFATRADAQREACLRNGCGDGSGGRLDWKQCNKDHCALAFAESRVNYIPSLASP